MISLLRNAAVIEMSCHFVEAINSLLPGFHSYGLYFTAGGWMPEVSAYLEVKYVLLWPALDFPEVSQAHEKRLVYTHYAKHIMLRIMYTPNTCIHIIPYTHVYTVITIVLLKFCHYG